MTVMWDQRVGHEMVDSRWAAMKACAPSSRGAAGVASLKNVDERLEFTAVDAAAVIGVKHSKCGLHILVQRRKGERLEEGLCCSESEPRRQGLETFTPLTTTRWDGTTLTEA